MLNNLLKQQPVVKIEKVQEVKSFNSAKFLDFEKERVQVLTLNQLAKTHKENDIMGNPIKGIYHYELINQLQEAAARHGLNTQIYDLFAANNADKNNPGVTLYPEMEDKYGKQAIEAHVLRRVYCNLQITNFDTPDYTTNFAIAYHQKGIQIGLGNNVKICHNQCMLGSKQFYLATYSDSSPFCDKVKSTEVKDIVATVDTWFATLEQSIVEERERIERWKARKLTDVELFQLIGLLQTTRVIHDTRVKEIREKCKTSHSYPLSQTQLNTFTENSIKKMIVDKEISLWDIYNIATDLYKGDSMEIPNILPQNSSMVEILEKTYSL